MKREFRHENFEDFIKRSADSLRMKAPDKIWQNLSGELNKRRRRLGIGLSTFFLLSAVLGYLTISTTTRQIGLTGQPFQLEQEQSAVNTNRQNNAEKPASRGQEIKAVTPSSKSQQEIAKSESTSQMFATEQFPAAVQNELLTQDFTPTIVDSYPVAEQNASATIQPKQNSHSSWASNTLPWSIESVTNAFAAERKRKNKRFQTQFHFTPTISYRKLAENKSYLRSTPQFSSPPNFAALYGSVNNMVTHKPDMGFELGITEKYSLTKKVRIRAGLQFNVNRYDIKAFRSPFSLAAITLNNRRSARVDSVWTITNYSNVEASSNKGSWLQNFSFQVSSPVGVELALKGSEKMEFGIATSIQPTYVLGDRAYLITSDYKSYTQVPWLLRRWNVNTAFETFVSYQSGKTKWQVGPQVRYQLLSSFITNYPVKENLFDFGLKVGVSINK